jgi:hypothetical protein
MNKQKSCKYKEFKNNNVFNCIDLQKNLFRDMVFDIRYFIKGLVGKSEFEDNFINKIVLINKKDFRGLKIKILLNKSLENCKFNEKCFILIELKGGLIFQ